MKNHLTQKQQSNLQERKSALIKKKTSIFQGFEKNTPNKIRTGITRKKNIQRKTQNLNYGQFLGAGEVRGEVPLGTHPAQARSPAAHTVPGALPRVTPKYSAV